ncbi:MAG: conjugal transfer protein TraF [Candidatus Obscuribacterales bacterium]|nr:conjugal transfer protein TraF [Candidatus Obscuribacterales bacterium]
MNTKKYTAIVIALLAVTVLAVTFMNYQAKSYESQNVTQVTDATFEQEVLDSKLPVLIMAYAPGCDPCAEYKPVFHKTADKNVGKVKFVAIDAQNNPGFAGMFGLQQVPATIYMSPQGNGNYKVAGFPGAPNQEQLEKALELLQKPDAKLIEIQIDKAPPAPEPDQGN